MYFYIIQTSLFVKIGITDNTDKRLTQLNTDNRIEKYKTYNLSNTPSEICNFIEISVMQNFQSQIEYIKKGNFEKICEYVNNLLSNIIYHYYFVNPLQTSLCCINNMYYDFKPATNYINHLRVIEGKNTFKAGDFAKTKQCNEFNQIICQNKKIETAIFTKQGSYGSTYGTAEMLFDFIISSSNIAKYEMLNWAINSRLEYKSFINPEFCENKREAVRIALENN